MKLKFSGVTGEEVGAFGSITQALKGKQKKEERREARKQKAEDAKAD